MTPERYQRNRLRSAIAMLERRAAAAEQEQER